VGGLGFENQVEEEVRRYSEREGLPRWACGTAGSPNWVSHDRLSAGYNLVHGAAVINV